MTRSEKALLGKVYRAEILAALQKSALTRLVQTRAKCAEKLIRDGLLREESISLCNGGIPCAVTGLVLTELGRLTYCAEC